MKKKKPTNPSNNTMNSTAFAELELSLKQALAYEKGQMDNLRVAKKVVPSTKTKAKNRKN